MQDLAHLPNSQRIKGLWKHSPKFLLYNFMYIVDDNGAVSVNNENVKIISEGKWDIIYD